MALNMTNITDILRQIPDILEPIPHIVMAMGEVSIYIAIIGLAVGVVFALRDYFKIVSWYRRNKY